MDLAAASVDGLAANLGIDGFSEMLRRAQRDEAFAAQGTERRKYADGAYLLERASNRAGEVLPIVNPVLAC